MRAELQVLHVTIQNANQAPGDDLRVHFSLVIAWLHQVSAYLGCLVPVLSEEGAGKQISAAWLLQRIDLQWSACHESVQG